MTTESKIPVSTVAGVGRGLRLGDSGAVQRSILDEGVPIEENNVPHTSNSEILEMGPSGKEEVWAVKGLLHDLTVDLVRRLPEILEFEGEITSDRCIEILEGAIDGTGRRSPEIRNDLAELEGAYDLQGQELLSYDISGYRDPHLSVDDAIEEIGGYAERYFNEAKEFGAIETEVSVSGEGMSGRMDAVWSGDRDRIIEIKTGTPSTYDRLQASAYWLMHGEDPEVLIEYPLENKRYSNFPDGQETEVFDPREESTEMIHYRDETIKCVQELKKLQGQYFESMESREEATRQALRDLEVPI